MHFVGVGEQKSEFMSIRSPSVHNTNLPSNPSKFDQALEDAEYENPNGLLVGSLRVTGSIDASSPIEKVGS